MPACTSACLYVVCLYACLAAYLPLCLLPSRFPNGRLPRVHWLTSAICPSAFTTIFCISDIWGVKRILDWMVEWLERPPPHVRRSWARTLAGSKPMTSQSILAFDIDRIGHGDMECGRPIVGDCNIPCSISIYNKGKKEEISKNHIQNVHTYTYKTHECSRMLQERTNVRTLSSAVSNQFLRPNSKHSGIVLLVLLPQNCGMLC